MQRVQPLTFGLLLKRYRRAAGLTQEELAERAELSVESVSALERGVSRAPHKDTVAMLAEAMALTGQDRTVFEGAARQRGDGSLSHIPSQDGVQLAASMSLVGRDSELALLNRHLSGKGPPVLLIAGEPGIGKSRLLQEAARYATASGWCVLEGNCYRGVREPYAPVLAALQQHLHRQTPSHIRDEVRHCAWLARLLPELAEARVIAQPPATLPPEQERRLIFDAVARFLGTIAGPAGTLLLLDNLQWASSDGLELLASLVRAPASVSLRMVGAYRDTEITPPNALAHALADLAREGLATRAKLGALVPDDARKLLRQLLSETVGADTTLQEQLLQRAGGVPFFLVSWAQSVQAGTLAAHSADDVPWDVAETIRQRITALGETAQEVLGTAAVATASGHPVTRTALVAATTRPDRDEEAVLLALEAACRAHLLVEDGEDAYQFAHNLIREVLWQDLGATRRAVTHRRIAEALERDSDGVTPEVLAYHFTSSGQRERAAVYLEKAGDRARAMHAHTAAEAQYRELVERLDSLGRVTDSARARVKLGTVLRIRAEYESALEVLERAAHDYRAAMDREGQAQAVAEIARVHARRGTLQAGIARIQPLLAAEQALPPSAGRAAMHVALADLFFASGRYHEQLTEAAHAAALAAALGDNALLTQAEQWRSSALLALGRHEEALPVLEQVIPRAKAAGDLSSHLHALNHTALAYTQRGEFGKSATSIERALTVAEERGDLVQIGFMRYNRGVLAFLRGDWKRARSDFEQAATAVRQIASAWTSTYPLIGLGQLDLAEGNRPSALQSLETALSLAEQSGDLQARQLAQHPLIEYDLLEGRYEAARARLESLATGWGAHHEEEHPHTLALLAWATAESGDNGQAELLAVQAVTRATTEHHRLALVEALRVRGLVALRRGEWAAAEEPLAEALALCHAMPYPYAEARILSLYGVLEVNRGQPAAGRARMDEARAIFAQLGEHLYAEHMERQWRRTPVK